MSNPDKFKHDYRFDDYDGSNFKKMNRKKKIKRQPPDARNQQKDSWQKGEYRDPRNGDRDRPRW